MKEAPVPALSNDTIPGCSNGRAVWWNLDSYKVIDGSMRLDDGRCVADMAIGEIAVLAEDAAIIERCAFRGDRKERLSKMGQKDDRREVMGLAGVSVSKEDARGGG